MTESANDKPKNGRRYTDEEKANAVELYRVHGTTKAAEMTGISEKTITTWAQAAGVSTEVVTKMTHAIEAAAAKRAVKREELKDLLLAKAVDMLHRTDEPHKDFRGKDADEVWWDKAPADACKNYSTSAAILIDKFELLSGNATSRTENNVSTDDLASYLQGAYDQFQRNQEKTPEVQG